MAKKQPAVSSTSASGAAPARAAKPVTSRTRTTKHSKATVTVERPAELALAAITAVEVTPLEILPVEIINVAAPVSAPAENPIEVISRLAYGYWEARGKQGGDPLQDWVRAEEEYRRSSAV